MSRANEIQRIAQAAIAEVLAGQKPPQTIWDGTPLEEFGRVEIDTRGSVGELLVVKLLEEGGRAPVYNRDATDTEKHWDFMCDGFSYEVKTASLGKGGRTFQHENIYKGRKYDGLIFVDIAPEDIYISMWAKSEIKWRELHFRHHGGFYKWDTSLTSLSSLRRGRKPNKWCVRQNAVRATADFMRRFAEMEKVIRAKKRPARSL